MSSADNTHPPTTPEQPATGKKQPPVILCIGMAGSGKTTFMQVKLFIKRAFDQNINNWL